MSSSPPTDVAHRPARWRSPAGWSLRARLVAIMIALLAMLGLIVGATAEIYLRSTLYDQLDSRLVTMNDRVVRGPGGFGPGGRPFRDDPPPGAQVGDIILQASNTAVVNGGIVVLVTGDDELYRLTYRPL